MCERELYGVIGGGGREGLRASMAWPSGGGGEAGIRSSGGRGGGGCVEFRSSLFCSNCSRISVGGDSRESVGRGRIAMRGRKHASRACFFSSVVEGEVVWSSGRGETAMILSAGAREVRGEGVGCWAGLDEVDLGGFLGLGDGGVRRKVKE